MSALMLESSADTDALARPNWRWVLESFFTDLDAMQSADQKRVLDLTIRAYVMALRDAEVITPAEYRQWQERLGPVDPGL